MEEWIISQRTIPMEIVDFMNETFEILEIRGLVGETNGIKFIVHTNEGKHHNPHVHAKYGEYEVSIDILTGDILVENIPKKNCKIAVEWVLSHKDKLLTDWKNIVISEKSSLTKSGLGFSKSET